MADTSGVPDVVRTELGGAHLGAASQSVSRWIRPSALLLPVAPTSMSIGSTAVLPPRKGQSQNGQARNGAKALHRSNVATLNSPSDTAVELLPVETLRKPSSSSADHPSGSSIHSTKTALRGQRPGRPRQSTTRPPSTVRNIQSFCQWCRQPLGPRNHSGRKRVYCSQSCRQRAYQSRKRSKQLGLREGELVVSSVLVTRMNRRLKALEKALADVEEAELHIDDQRIAELCQAARRLRRLVVGPPTR
jgi:hypothetical protein